MPRSRSSLPVYLSFVLLGGMIQAPPAAGSQAADTSSAPRVQRQRTPAGTVAKLNAILNLSSDQQTAIVGILENLQMELVTLKSSGTPVRTAPADRQAFISSTTSQVRALLTESQQALFDAIRPQQRAQIFGR